MSEPGSSGRDGLTPISSDVQGTDDREQARPSFHFKGWTIATGDLLSGVHRASRRRVSGPVVIVQGCLCVDSGGKKYVLTNIAIHEVQPPLFDLGQPA